MPRAYSSLPPIEKLREFFDYNPETGRIFWTDRLDCRHRHRAGKAAGILASSGQGQPVRFQVLLNRKKYPAERVAWALATGEDPGSDSIICVNGNELDLRRQNLARVDCDPQRYLCIETRKISTNNSSGYTGVSCSKDPRNLAKPWKATMTVKGKKYYLGSFDTKEEAIEARVKAEKKILAAPPDKQVEAVSAIARQCPRRKSNASGYTGIYFHKGKWCAAITVNRKKIYLGRFVTKEEASAARKKAEVELLGKAPTS